MTSTLARTASNGVTNPFRRGDRVVIPAGTLIHTTMSGDKNRKIAGRTYSINARMVGEGFVDLWNHHCMGNGYVVLPTVTWAGESGYWHEVQVTESLCKANGISMPALPDLEALHPYDVSRLDVIPAYGSGYDNRWAAE